MKTTIEFSAATLRQAELQAAVRGISMQRFITAAVRARLRRGRAATGDGRAEPPWMEGFGALADLSDETQRVLDLIEREFESARPEDSA